MACCRQGFLLRLSALRYVLVCLSMRAFILWTITVLAIAANGAERRFDFSEVKENELPPGFRSALTGGGAPGVWKVVLDDVPPGMQPLTPQAKSVTKRPVLAQVSQDPTDERFPLLIYEDESFGDFTLTTRFKTVRGTHEQMAGLIFRAQNETNYYVVRASSLGNTFRFYKVVNGQRGTIIGPEVEIPAGEWHEMTVVCFGNQIRCLLNGKEVIPPLTDHSFVSGKVGFWTKSDSVSYFADARITYTPREPVLQGIVQAMIKKYPRLLGLKVYVPGSEPGTTRVAGSKEKDELGQPGGDTEYQTITREQVYHVKLPEAVAVVMPLRDRNGEPIAAVRVIMSTFKGQTEKNAVIRASPIVKEMQARIVSLDNVLE